MFDTIYVGMTGLQGYSRGLNVISNNVANLNTPGFKSSQLQFSDLFYQFRQPGNGQADAELIGTGVNTGSTFLNFKQGEARQTGNDLDMLIEGSGFFVLRKDDELQYTRAGQFAFDAEGFLVDKSTNARVAALNSEQQLVDINITGLKSNPPKATTTIKFASNLSTGDNQHVIDNVTVYDQLGGTHTLKITFDNINVKKPGAWTVTVAEGTQTIATREISFKDGKPVVGSDTVSFEYTPKDAATLTLTLDFSAESTAFAEGVNSTLKVGSQDGYASGSLLKASFDKDGYFVTSYSNGQTAKHQQLALATFDDLNGLEVVGGNIYLNSQNQTVHLGHPSESVYGKITSGSIETSNVDLTQQFGDLIITQRGYQASSQIITTANEMIQQLFDIRGKR
jgi:flagellar hook protein FlgE